MLPSLWKTSLNQLLERQVNESDIPAKIAFVGIGNKLRSDDAAGILVVQKLMQSRCVRHLKHVLVMDAGHAPENMTGELRRFAPDVIMLMDAAEMGELPGTVRWIPMEALDGMSASTHSMPLSMLAGYLTLELPCAVALLGIQLRSNGFGDIVSPEVLQAIDEIVKEVWKSLC